MSQNAIVKKIVGEGVAEISLMRQLECGLSCKSCEGCPQKPKEEILALANNPIGAVPGDWVEVELASGSAIGVAALVYLVPCVTLLGGYLVGQGLGLGEGASVGLGAVGLLLGFLPAIWLNRRIVRRSAPEFSILKRLRPAS